MSWFQILLLSLFMTPSQAQSWLVDADCFPNNEMRISTFTKSQSGLSEFQTNQIIQNFIQTLSPIVKSQLSKKLMITLDWVNDRVNASTTRDDENNPLIKIYGGMARHSELNEMGLVAILCHELGHHLGGAPKKFRGRSSKRSWSSAEGQADYYASTKCLPIFFEKNKESYNYSSYVDQKNISGIDQKCGNEHSCIKTVLAGLSVTRVFASLKGYWEMPELGAVDRTEVWETNYGHPTPQCRLDTILNGLDCNVSPYEKFDDNDPQVGSCVYKTEESNQFFGARPRCWYSSELL